VALTLAVFLQVRRHEFVDFDDETHIVRNPSLRASSPGAALLTAFTDTSLDSWMPLTVLSLQLDRALYGAEPRGYLLTNVALHALAAVVLFLALAAMTGSTGRSAFVAAVFTVHPLHVESVAWASERKDVLSGLFWMLTLAAYARYAAQPGARRYALVTLAFALGLLAKPMLVTLPGVLLLLDYWPLRRLGRRAWLEKIPLLALSAAASFATLRAQRAIGATDFGDAIPLGQRLANAIESYVAYLGLGLWPSGLAVFYPHPGASIPPLRVAAAACALAALCAAALRLRRSRPYLLVGWLWYLGTLVPVIGLVQVGGQARADRYTYVPLVGLAIALAWGAADLVRTRAGSRALAAVGAAAVAALAAAAWVQVGYWRDSLTLLERNLAVAPDSYVAHAQLAVVHVRKGRLERAEPHVREAYRLMPEMGRENLIRFLLTAGLRSERQGDAAGAVERYREARRLAPEDERAQAALRRALVAAGGGVEVRAMLERSLRETPEDARILVELGHLDLAEGHHAEAVARTREALRLRPDLASARNNLAWLLATAPDPSLRDPDEALRLAEGLVAQARAPSANLLDTLAAAQAAAGRSDEAVATALRALEAAGRMKDDALARAIRERLDRYRSGAAWIETGPAPAP
jgi:tetratricopeptide (TPR) repeat protein